jgi:hypothetical protein
MNRNVQRYLNGCLIILALSARALATVPNQGAEWIRQFGTIGFDGSYSVAADGSGNAYVTGSTTGDIGGPNAGNRDVFVRKYDSTGGLLWSRQFGTSFNDEGLAMAVDKLGNVYISGFTGGSLVSSGNGSDDAFLSKLNSSGSILWTRQVGSHAGDSSWNVAADGLGSVFIVGQTFGNMADFNRGLQDAFVSKFDDAGNLAWTRQFGTSSYDTCLGVAGDGQGGVYVSGKLNNTFGYLSRLDASGTEVWQKILDPNYSDSSGVAVDNAGGVYVLGSTGGWPQESTFNVFLTKYNSAGLLQWREDFGSSAADYAFDMALDASGRIYISGETKGDLGGLNAGSYDVFVSSFETTGEFRWTRQFGTATDEGSRGLSADGLGNVFLSGYATSKFGEIHAGSTDAYLIKIADVPEPSAMGLIVVAFLSLHLLRIKHSRARG